MRRLRGRARKDIAVIVHVFYPDIWPEVLQALRRLSHVPFDVFVTVPARRRDICERITLDLDGARLLEVPNRGRDAAPFLHVASRVDLLGYPYVLKLHTKKSPHRRALRGWLQEILTSLAPSDTSVQQELLDTLRREDTGLIGPRGQYFTLPFHYRENRSHVLRLVAAACSRDCASDLDRRPGEFGYFAGTMFWARLDALRPIVERGFGSADFEPEEGQIDGTFAHGMERAFSLVPELNGRAMYEAGPDGITRIAHRTRNVPAWALPPARRDAVSEPDHLGT